MGFVLGFLPWILLWTLIGNVAFQLVVCLVLAVALGTQVVTGCDASRGKAWRSGVLRCSRCWWWPRLR